MGLDLLRKLLLIILAIALVAFFTPFALVVFPGVIIFFTLIHQGSFSEKVFYSIAFSLAYWIVGFSFLKFVPISLTVFVATSLALSFLVWSYQVISGQIRQVRISKSDVFWIGVFAIAGFFMLKTYFGYYVAAGADMATHTYTARVIFDANKFPTTHEPIVPIDTFGFAPYGLSVLSAVTSLFTSLPVHRSSFLVAVLAYPFLAGAFYVFLKNYFSTFAILATIVFLFAYESNLSTYVGWGGNTTILSLAFFIASLGFFISSFKRGAFTISLGFVGTIMLAASFYTHQSFLIMLCGFTILCMLHLLVKREFALFKQIIILCGIMWVFLLPFIFSMQPLVLQEFEHVNSWKQNEDFFEVPKNIMEMYPSAVSNILRWHSDKLYLLFLFGIFLSLWRKTSHFYIYVIALSFMLFLIIYAYFLELPLSPILYPDRILTLALIPISYFVTNIFEYGKKIMDDLIKSEDLPIYLLLLIWIPSLVWVSYTKIKYLFDKQVIEKTQLYSSVTEDDMNVFAWIKKNTTNFDVIGNNYGDAGVWIPAIVGRKINVNDFNAHFLSEALSKQGKLIPNYIFIGSKTVYEDAILYTEEKIATDSAYSLLYSSGNAKVYKVNN